MFKVTKLSANHLYSSLYGLTGDSYNSTKQRYYQISLGRKSTIIFKENFSLDGLTETCFILGLQYTGTLKGEPSGWRGQDDDRTKSALAI